MAAADSLVRRGIRLAESGKQVEALAEFNRALELAPQHPLGLLHMALAHAAEQHCAEITQPLERALESHPESAAFRILAGRALFDCGEYRAAAAEFRRATELNPANDLAGGFLSLSEWAAGNSGAAIRFQPAQLPDSTPFLARLLMLIEEEMKGRAHVYVNDAIVPPLLDRPRIAYLLWRAQNARKAGNYDPALAFADTILELQPGYIPAVECARSVRQDALAAARRKVAESPTNPDFRLELSLQLAESELFEEAWIEFEESKNLVEESHQPPAVGEQAVARLAARILFHLGRIEESLSQVEAGAEPGFSMPETQYYRGLCLLAKGKRADCVREFESVITALWWAVPIRYREFLAWRRTQQPA